MMVASEQCRHRSQAKYQGPAVPALASSESNSTPQPVGSAPPSVTKIGTIEDNGGYKSAQATSARPSGRPPKVQPVAGGRGNSPPSSMELEAADSEGYSTVSEAPGDRCRRRHRNEKCLNPACLDMPIFNSTDPNTDSEKV